jgi:hypothetical protein
VQFTPTQLALLCVAIFGGVVGISLLSRVRSDDDFRDKMSHMSASDLLKTRTKLINQENMVPENEEELQEAE